MRYVALPRGISVGGANKVSMADLKAAFEAAGMTEVRTYIIDLLLRDADQLRALVDALSRPSEKLA